MSILFRECQTLFRDAVAKRRGTQARFAKDRRRSEQHHCDFCSRYYRHGVGLPRECVTGPRHFIADCQKVAVEGQRHAVITHVNRKRTPAAAHRRGFVYAGICSAIAYRPLKGVLDDAYSAQLLGPFSSTLTKTVTVGSISRVALNSYATRSAHPGNAAVVPRTRLQCFLKQVGARRVMGMNDTFASEEGGAGFHWEGARSAVPSARTCVARAGSEQQDRYASITVGDLMPCAAITNASSTADPACR